jgi:hypothetical protein
MLRGGMEAVTGGRWVGEYYKLASLEVDTEAEFGTKRFLLGINNCENEGDHLSTGAHACNPSYLGDRDWEDHSLRPVWANSSWDPIPHLQNNQSKMDWRCDSSGRVPGLQVKKPSAQTPIPPKKKKKGGGDNDWVEEAFELWWWK